MQSTFPFFFPPAKKKKKKTLAPPSHLPRFFTPTFINQCLFGLSILFYVHSLTAHSFSWFILSTPFSAR